MKIRNKEIHGGISRYAILSGEKKAEFLVQSPITNHIVKYRSFYIKDYNYPCIGCSWTSFYGSKSIKCGFIEQKPTWQGAILIIALYVKFSGHVKFLHHFLVFHYCTLSSVNKLQGEPTHFCTCDELRHMERSIVFLLICWIMVLMTSSTKKNKSQASCSKASKRVQPPWSSVVPAWRSCVRCTKGKVKNLF